MLIISNLQILISYVPTDTKKNGIFRFFMVELKHFVYLQNQN